MHQLNGSRRPTDPRTRPCAQRVIGVLFVAVGLTLHGPAALAASGCYPSLDLLALTSERIELVRVVAPQDTSRLPPLTSGRVVHYQVVTRLLGSGRSPGSVTLYSYSADVPLVGDTLLVFWELRRRMDFEDGTRYVTVVDLTDQNLSIGWPALTSDFRVARSTDSLLAIVVLRAAMVRARCPLGDERPLSLVDFVEGRGCVVRWMPPESEANDWANPMSMNQLASPADAKMLPSCRSRVAGRLRKMRADGFPVLSRAATLALLALDGRPLR
jgi:hypothetical protein